MSCEPLNNLTCETLCGAKPATNLKVTLIRNRILSTDTSIEISAIPAGESMPCAGFGLFTGCNGGKRELIYFGSISIANNGNILLGEVKRGLAFTGSDTTANRATAYAHSRSEEFIIGDTGIHYYFTQLCACLDELRGEARRIYSTVVQLPRPGNVGERAIVWNGGSPVLYIYNSLGGNIYDWRPLNATVSLASETTFGVSKLFCPPSDPLNPRVYNEGCPALDLIAQNAYACNNNAIGFGDIALIANYGAYINNILVDRNLGPLVITDFSTIDLIEQIDSYAFTVDTNASMLIDLLINKASVAALPEVPSSEYLYAVVRDVTNGVDIYTTPLTQTSVDENTNVTPLLKWRDVRVLGKVLNVLPGIDYEVRVFARFNQISLVSYVEAQYSRVIYNLTVIPRCL